MGLVNLNPGMKKIFILFTLLISMSVFAQDMRKYLTETNEMVKQRKYQEANERYEWFQNHSLEYAPSMGGVRLSFALSNWKSLADIYPPAMVSMKQMRDKKMKQLVDSNVTYKLFADITALNRILSQEEKTITLFETIDKKSHYKAKELFPYAKNALFKSKRYDVLRKFIGDPLNEFQIIIGERNMLVEQVDKYKNNDKYASNIIKNQANDNFVEKCLNLIKFSLAVKDFESASKIRTQAQLIVKDNRLRDIELTKGKR
jgi:hypothetical protein